MRAAELVAELLQQGPEAQVPQVRRTLDPKTHLAHCCLMVLPHTQGFRAPCKALCSCTGVATINVAAKQRP